MQNVLMINAAAEFALIAKAELNFRLTQFAQEYLQNKAAQVKVSPIEQGYDVDDEVEKYPYADVVFYQMPGWWMALA